MDVEAWDAYVDLHGHPPSLDAPRVRCPRCGAKPRRACRNPETRSRLSQPHKERVDALARATQTVEDMP